MNTEYLRIAQIVRPHGVHGAVKLLPLTDDVKRFQILTEAFIEEQGQYRATSVQKASIQQDAVILQLSCSTTREAAEQLRNHYLCVDRAHAVPLPEGRYFIVDLIGCRAFDTTGMEYGTVTDVLETGANDVYEVKGSKNMLVPALKKVIHEVDIPHKRIVFDRTALEEVALFED